MAQILKYIFINDVKSIIDDKNSFSKTLLIDKCIKNVVIPKKLKNTSITPL